MKKRILFVILGLLILIAVLAGVKALQIRTMIEHGKKILTAEVGGWYDCGKLDTLLETNAILLGKGAATPVTFPGVTIHDPVYVEGGVTIERSVIGPNVSIERGTRISDSRLVNAIVGRDAVLRKVELDGAMLGDSVVVEGLRGSATLGDHSEVSAKA
jgi:glucose-1-phosphate thymidylyltransferase